MKATGYGKLNNPLFLVVYRYDGTIDANVPAGIIERIHYYRGGFLGFNIKRIGERLEIQTCYLRRALPDFNLFFRTLLLP